MSKLCGDACTSNGRGCPSSRTWTSRFRQQQRAPVAVVLPSPSTSGGATVASGGARRPAPAAANGGGVPGGVPVERWFALKFASGRPAYEVFCDEFDSLQQADAKERAVAPLLRAPPPPLLRPSRAAKPRTIQSSTFTVNAHYLDGYQGRRYIACEGPNRTSVYDFWEMCWQEDVAVILMLNQPYEERLSPRAYNPMHETIQYWPIKPSEVKHWAPWKVTCLSTELRRTPADAECCSEDCADYTYRLTTISISEHNPILQSKSRKLVHICHYRWPDCQIPLPIVGDEGGGDRNEYALAGLVMLDVMRLTLADVGRRPIVVHCHAGVGRTGVGVALDIADARLRDRRFADVRETVRRMREQRPHAVMNVWQYAYINAMLAELALRDGLLPERLPASSVDTRHRRQHRHRERRPAAAAGRPAVHCRALIDECWRALTDHLLTYFAAPDDNGFGDDDDDDAAPVAP